MCLILQGYFHTLLTGYSRFLKYAAWCGVYLGTRNRKFFQRLYVHMSVGCMSLPKQFTPLSRGSWQKQEKKKRLSELHNGHISLPFLSNGCFPLTNDIWSIPLKLLTKINSLGLLRNGIGDVWDGEMLASVV